MVEERCLCTEARSKERVEFRQVSMPTLVTIRGVRNSSAESPRVPGPGSSSQGKPDPKSRPKGVDDGKRVNIPVLLLRAMEGRSRVGQPHVG